MRVDWWPKIADLRPEIADSRHERADFRPETAWEGRRNRWTDAQTKVPVPQDFVPFRAAALLPLTTVHNHAK